MSKAEDKIEFELPQPPDLPVKAVEQGTEKALLPAGNLIVLGLLAGVYISLGGLFSQLALAGGDQLPHGVAQVLAGVVFSLGLILVIVCGAELFTGNILFAVAWAENAISSAQVLRAWGIAYAANLAASLVVAALAILAGTHLEGDGALGAAALEVAAAKAELPPLTAFVSGILANLLVCLAVWLAFSARTTTDMVFAITPPIAAFVAIGLEHSVANMYLIPYGLMVKHFAGPEFWADAGLSAAAFDGLTVGGFIANLIPVTLGNIVGGVLLSAAYWWVYLRKPD
jgi:formate transporter